MHVDSGLDRRVPVIMTTSDGQRLEKRTHELYKIYYDMFSQMNYTDEYLVQDVSRYNRITSSMIHD